MKTPAKIMFMFFLCMGVCFALGRPLRKGNKSICYIDRLLALDASIQDLNLVRSRGAVNKLKKALANPYYSQVPLPHSMTEAFFKSLQEYPKLTPEDVAKFVEQELLPVILETEREARSADLDSELQISLLIRRKAKKYGISPRQHTAIVRSSFLYIPFAFNYACFGGAGSQSCQSQMGMLWYEFINRGADAVLIKKIVVSAAGLSRKGGEEAAFRAMVEKGVEGLVAATQKITALNVTSQVVKKNNQNIVFYSKSTEGVRVDDLYWALKRVRVRGGKFKEKRAGWVRVTQVSKSESKRGYPVGSRVVSGNVGSRNVLRKISRWPVDVRLAYTKFPLKARYYSQDSSSYLFITDAPPGFEVSAFYNVGWLLGFGLIRGGIAYGRGGGASQGKYASLDNVQGTGEFTVNRIRIPVTKGFSFRRLHAELGACFGYQWCHFPMADPFAMTNSAKGLNFGGGLAAAVMPRWFLHASVMYQGFGKSGNWTYLRDGESYLTPLMQTNPFYARLNYSGFCLGLGAEWSLPEFTFKR